MNDKNPGWKQVEPMRRFQDAGKRRRVRTDSGKTRMLPALPFEYWCKPNGNLVRLAVMTTRNVAQAINPTYYATYARADARKHGFFAWDWNDAQAFTPGVVAQSACTNAQEWDKWRHEEQKRRREAHEEQTRKAQAVWLEQAGQRKLESKEAFSEALKGFTEGFAEIMKSQAAQDKKPRGSNG